MADDPKKQYTNVNMTGTYFKLPGWFFMWSPLNVPYGKLVPTLEKAGFKVKANTTKGVIEKGAFIGKGWIAIEIEPVATNDKRVFNIDGEFTSFTHKGSYKELGKVWQKIMKEHPDKNHEMYSLYLNSPRKVSESELLTKIIFR